MTGQMHHKQSLTDATYQKLRNRILTGKFPPGTKLVVNDLAAEWKISNTPIKEALNRLLTEGLVAFEPRRGMRVRRPLTVEEVREKYELRAIIEEHCCGLAVEAAEKRPAILDEMAVILKKTEGRLNDASRYIELYQLDSAFHNCIVRHCGNADMMQLHEQLSTALATFGIQASQPHPLRRQQATLNEHKAILEALAQKNGDALRTSMRNHLHEAMRRLLEFYAASSGTVKTR